MKRALRGGVMAAGLAGLFGAFGCHGGMQPRLLQDPFEHKETAPAALYTVGWWQRLVTEVPLLEYLPREMASPAVDPTSGRVIALTRDGYIRCLDKTGKVQWKFRTYGRVAAGAKVQDGIAYIPGSNGKLYAFKVLTGEKLWEYDSTEELSTVPVLANGRLFVASQNDTLFAVDQKTGKWIWQYRRDPPQGFTIRGVSTPLVTANDHVIVGFADGHLVSLAASDGALAWDKLLSNGSQFIDVDSSPVLDAEGFLYAASYKDGLYKLHADDGSIVWEVKTTGISVVVVRGNEVIAGGDERISAYSTHNGESLWNLALKKRPAHVPIFAGGSLLLPTSEELLFVDPLTGTPQLKFDPGKGVSATPALVGDHLFVLSNLGYLYDLRLQPGHS